jgi:hypothetical protein
LAKTYLPDWNKTKIRRAKKPALCKALRKAAPDIPAPPVIEEKKETEVIEIVDDEEHIVEEDIDQDPGVVLPACITDSQLPLTEYQKNTVMHWLANNNNNIMLAYEMGLGKTLTAVTMIECELAKRDTTIRRIVVVTPLALHATFQTAMNRYGVSPNHARLYNFITPEAFLRQYKDKPEKAAFGDGHTLVVVDESHLYKGLGAVQQSANDYKTARVLQKALEHANRIILMTGISICLSIRVFFKSIM